MVQGQPWSSSSSTSEHKRKQGNTNTAKPPHKEQHGKRTTSSTRKKQQKLEACRQRRTLQQSNGRRTGRRTARDHGETMLSESGTRCGDIVYVDRKRDLPGGNSSKTDKSDKGMEHVQHSSICSSGHRGKLSLGGEVHPPQVVPITFSEGPHAALQAGTVESSAAAAVLMSAATEILAGKPHVMTRLSDLLKDLLSRPQPGRQMEQLRANEQLEVCHQRPQTLLPGKRQTGDVSVMPHSKEHLRQQQKQEVQQEHQRSRGLQQQQQIQPNHTGQLQQRSERQEGHQQAIQKKLPKEQVQTIRMRNQARVQEKSSPGTVQPQRPCLQQGKWQPQPTPPVEVRQRERLTQYPLKQPLQAKEPLMLRRTLGEYVGFEEFSAKRLLLWESLCKGRRLFEGLPTSMQYLSFQESRHDAAMSSHISQSPGQAQMPLDSTTGRRGALCGSLPDKSLLRSLMSLYRVLAVTSAHRLAELKGHVDNAASLRGTTPEGDTESREACIRAVDVEEVVSVRVGVSARVKALGNRRTATLLTPAVAGLGGRQTITASSLRRTWPALHPRLLSRYNHQVDPEPQTQKRQQRQLEHEQGLHSELQRDLRLEIAQQQQHHKQLKELQQQDYICNQEVFEEVFDVPVEIPEEALQQEGLSPEEERKRTKNLVLIAACPITDIQPHSRFSAFSGHSLSTQELRLSEDLTPLESTLHKNNALSNVEVKQNRRQQRQQIQRQQEKKRRRHHRQQQRERDRQRQQLPQLHWLQQLRRHKTVKRHREEYEKQPWKQEQAKKRRLQLLQYGCCKRGGQERRRMRLRLYTRQKFGFKVKLRHTSPEEGQKVYNKEQIRRSKSLEGVYALRAKTIKPDQAKQQRVCTSTVNSSEGKWVPPTEAALAALNQSMPLPLVQQHFRKRRIDATFSSKSLMLAKRVAASRSSSGSHSRSGGEKLEVLLLHAVEAVEPASAKDVNAAIQTRALRRRAAAAAAHRKECNGIAGGMPPHVKGKKDEMGERGPDALWKLWCDRQEHEEGRQRQQRNWRISLHEREYKSQPPLEYVWNYRRQQRQQWQAVAHQGPHKQQLQRQLQRTGNSVNVAVFPHRHPQTNEVTADKQQERRSIHQHQLQLESLTAERSMQPREKSQYLHLSQALVEQLNRSPLQRHLTQSWTQTESGASSSLLHELLHLCAPAVKQSRKYCQPQYGAHQTPAQQEMVRDDTHVGAGAAKVRDTKDQCKPQFTDAGAVSQKLQPLHQCISKIQSRQGVPHEGVPKLEQQTCAPMAASSTQRGQPRRQASYSAFNPERYEETARQRQPAEQALFALAPSKQQLPSLQHLQHCSAGQAEAIGSTRGRAAVVACRCPNVAARSEVVAVGVAGGVVPDALSANCGQARSTAVRSGSRITGETREALPRCGASVASRRKGYRATAANTESGGLDTGRFTAAIKNTEDVHTVSYQYAAAAATSDTCGSFGVASTQRSLAPETPGALVHYNIAASVASGKARAAIEARKHGRTSVAAIFEAEARGAASYVGAVARGSTSCQTREITADKWEEESATRRKNAMETLMKVRCALLAAYLGAYDSGTCAGVRAGTVAHLDVPVTAPWCNTTPASSRKSNSKHAGVSCVSTTEITKLPYRYAATGVSAEAPRQTEVDSVPLQEEHQGATQRMCVPQQDGEQSTSWIRMLLKQYQRQQERCPPAFCPGKTARSCFRNVGKQMGLSEDAKLRLLGEHWFCRRSLSPGRPVEPHQQKQAHLQSEPQKFQVEFQQQECQIERTCENQQMPLRNFFSLQQHLLREPLNLMEGGLRTPNEHIQNCVMYAPFFEQRQYQEKDQEVQRHAQQSRACRPNVAWAGAVPAHRRLPHGLHTTPAADAATIEAHGWKSQASADRSGYSIQTPFVGPHHQQTTQHFLPHSAESLMKSARRNDPSLTTVSTFTAADAPLHVSRTALQSRPFPCSPLNYKEVAGKSSRHYSGMCFGRRRCLNRNTMSKSKKHATKSYTLNLRSKTNSCRLRSGESVSTSKRCSSKRQQLSKSRSRDRVSEGNVTSTKNRTSRNRSRPGGSGKGSRIGVAFTCNYGAAAASAVEPRRGINSLGRENCRQCKNRVHEILQRGVLKHITRSPLRLRDNVISAATTKAKKVLLEHARRVTAAYARKTTSKSKATFMHALEKKTPEGGNGGLTSARRALPATEVIASLRDGLALENYVSLLMSARDGVLPNAGHNVEHVSVAPTTQAECRSFACMEAVAALKDTASNRAGGLLPRSLQEVLCRNESNSSNHFSRASRSRPSSSKTVHYTSGNAEQTEIQELHLQKPNYSVCRCHACALKACAATKTAFRFCRAYSKAAADRAVENAVKEALVAPNIEESAAPANGYAAASLSQRRAWTQGENRGLVSAAVPLRFNASETSVAARNVADRKPTGEKLSIVGRTAARRQRGPQAATRISADVTLPTAAPAFTGPQNEERDRALRPTRRHISTRSVPQRVWIQKTLAASPRGKSLPRTLQMFNKARSRCCANSDTDGCRGRNSCGGDNYTRHQQLHTANNTSFRSCQNWVRKTESAATTSNVVGSVSHTSIRARGPHATTVFLKEKADGSFSRRVTDGSSLEKPTQEPLRCCLLAAKASIPASVAAPASGFSTLAVATERYKGEAGDYAHLERNDDGFVLLSQSPTQSARAAAAAVGRRCGELHRDRCSTDAIAYDKAAVSRPEAAGKGALLCISPSPAGTPSIQSPADLAASLAQAAVGFSALPGVSQRHHAKGEQGEAVLKHGDGLVPQNTMGRHTRDALLRQFQPHFQLPVEKLIKVQETVHLPLQRKQPIWNSGRRVGEEMSDASYTELICRLLTAQQMQREVVQQLRLQLQGEDSKQFQQVKNTPKMWRQQQCELLKRLQHQRQAETTLQQELKSTGIHSSQACVQHQSVDDHHMQRERFQQQRNQHGLSQSQQLNIEQTHVKQHPQQRAQKAKGITGQLFTARDRSDSLRKNHHRQMMLSAVPQQRQPLKISQRSLKTAFERQQLQSLLYTLQHMQQHRQTRESGGTQQAIRQSYQQTGTQHQQQANLQLLPQLLTQPQQASSQQQQALMPQQPLGTQKKDSKSCRMRERQQQQVPAAAAGVTDLQKTLNVRLLPYLQLLNLLQQQNKQLIFDGCSRSCTQEEHLLPLVYRVSATQSVLAQGHQQAHPLHEEVDHTGVQTVSLHSEDKSLLSQSQQRLPCTQLPHILDQLLQLLRLKHQQHNGSALQQQQQPLPTTEQRASLQPQQQHTSHQQSDREQQQQETASANLQQLKAAVCFSSQASARQYLLQVYWLERLHQHQLLAKKQHSQQSTPMKVSLRGVQAEHFIGEGHERRPFAACGNGNCLHELHGTEHFWRQQSGVMPRTIQDYLAMIGEQREQPRYYQHPRATSRAAY